MCKAENYRKRAAGIRGGMKKRAAHQPAMNRKQKAPDDMAANEDWLEGKSPKRLSATSCRKQAANCREEAKAAMTEAHRIMLAHIAETWDRLAAEVEAQS